MKSTCILIICAICAICGYSADTAKIIPVTSWPREINIPGKQIINPSRAQCIAAGYRILQPSEAVPADKLIDTETIIQDPDNPAQAIIVRTYKDKPAVSPSTPPVITNVSVENITFQFTTDGYFVGVIWNDAPSTNSVKQ